MNAEYPTEYDDAIECESCGDDPMNAPQPNPEEPMEHCCCSWQCYAIKLKCELDGARATTRRDQVTRRDEEISDLRHEIESARDAARGENALRLDAERERDEARGSLEKQREYTKLAMGERDTLRADVERWVKEVAHLKLAAEKAERESAS